MYCLLAAVVVVLPAEAYLVGVALAWDVAPGSPVTVTSGAPSSMRRIAAASDRVRFRELGKSTNGNPFIMLEISMIALVCGLLGMPLHPRTLAESFGVAAVIVAVALVVGSFAVVTMLTKNTFVEEIRKQYVMTAQAKGLAERQGLYGHVFRNAMLLIIAGSTDSTNFNLFKDQMMTLPVFIYYSYTQPGNHPEIARPIPRLPPVTMAVFMDRSIYRPPSGSPRWPWRCQSRSSNR